MWGFLYPVAREKLDYASAAEGEGSLLEEVSRRPLLDCIGRSWLTSRWYICGGYGG